MTKGSFGPPVGRFLSFLHKKRVFAYSLMTRVSANDRAAASGVCRVQGHADGCG